MIKIPDILSTAYIIPGIKNAKLYIRGGMNLFQDIKYRTCDFYGVDEKLLSKPTRKREVVTARHVIIYLTREFTNLSFLTLGREFKRHHTSIMHAAAKVKKLLAEDKQFFEDLEYIKKHV